MQRKRMCIFPKDIQRITGYSERYSRQYWNAVKATLGKQQHQLITVEEFASYAGLPVDEVRKYILD